MKISKSIIFLIVLASGILLYFMLFYGKANFELKQEIVMVNIHDTINLRDYISAKDINRKNLINKVKIEVDVDLPNKLENNKLYIGDFSPKTVTYTLKYKFKKYTKTLNVIVISDPMDPGFKPNYDYEDIENTDDVPNNQVNNSLTAEQKSYIDSLE